MAVNASPGVAGAASEHPLEGVAEDPARVGKKNPRLRGDDTMGGAGTEARGRLPPHITTISSHAYDIPASYKLRIFRSRACP